MQVDYRYDPDKGVLFGVLRGRLTIEDFEEKMAAMLGSGDFPVDAKTLWDMRDVDFVSIDRRVLERMISSRKKHPERGRAQIAYVVSGQLALGMTRMYEILSSELPQQTRVFTDLGKAERWLLGSDEPSPQTL